LHLSINGHATHDLYEVIEKGDYPEWELCVQIMSDDYHINDKMTGLIISSVIF
jgi:catalase